MDEDETRRKLEALCGNNQSGWQENAIWTKDNSFWLKKSGEISLSVLNIMNKKRISAKELADSVGISVERLHQYLSGNENMDLKTICSFERELGVEIIRIDVNYP